MKYPRLTMQVPSTLKGESLRGDIRWKSVVRILLAGVMGLAVTFPSAALADRQYGSCAACNAKCHGVCFMNGDGCGCFWGAKPKTDLKTPAADKKGPSGVKRMSQ